jgi:hypothetical protein
MELKEMLKGKTCITYDILQILHPGTLDFSLFIVFPASCHLGFQDGSHAHAHQPCTCASAMHLRISTWAFGQLQNALGIRKTWTVDNGHWTIASLTIF